MTAAVIALAVLAAGLGALVAYAFRRGDRHVDARLAEAAVARALIEQKDAEAAELKRQRDEHAARADRETGRAELFKADNAAVTKVLAETRRELAIAHEEIAHAVQAEIAGADDEHLARVVQDRIGARRAAMRAREAARADRGAPDPAPLPAAPGA